MPVLAQNSGIISGRVTDPTGAVVPGAQIAVTQTDTNVDSVSQSNSEGLFRVPGLRDGPYKLAVAASGFKKAVREGFNLRIGENLDVEMTLEVGAVSEAVEVTAALPLLETQTSSTGQVMEGDYFYELPNYQHWEKGVLYYTPQVETSNAPWPGSLGNWNFNGANSYQTAQFEDGQLATTIDGGATVHGGGQLPVFKLGGLVAVGAVEVPIAQRSGPGGVAGFDLGGIVQDALLPMLIVGQFVEIIALHHLAGGRGLRLEQGKCGGDLDGFGNRAHFERHLHVQILAYAEVEALAHGLLESAGGDGQLIRAIPEAWDR